MTELKVLDVMTHEVVTIGADETLDVAEQAMRVGRIHHLPVVHYGKRLVGVVTQHDLLRADMSVFADVSPSIEMEIKRSIPVSRVMSRSVCTVEPNDSAMRAARLLKRHKYGCLPVVKRGFLVGIVTEGDFVDVAMLALNASASSTQATLDTPSNCAADLEIR